MQRIIIGLFKSWAKKVHMLIKVIFHKHLWLFLEFFLLFWETDSLGKVDFVLRLIWLLLGVFQMNNAQYTSIVFSFPCEPENIVKIIKRNGWIIRVLVILFHSKRRKDYYYESYLKSWIFNFLEFCSKSQSLLFC